MGRKIIESKLEQLEHENRIKNEKSCHFFRASVMSSETRIREILEFTQVITAEEEIS